MKLKRPFYNKYKSKIAKQICILRIGKINVTKVLVLSRGYVGNRT